jgi:hypothetical protein
LLVSLGSDKSDTNVRTGTKARKNGVSDSRGDLVACGRRSGDRLRRLSDGEAISGGWQDRPDFSAIRAFETLPDPVALAFRLQAWQCEAR